MLILTFSYLQESDPRRKPHRLHRDEVSVVRPDLRCKNTLEACVLSKPQPPCDPEQCSVVLSVLTRHSEDSLPLAGLRLRLRYPNELSEVANSANTDINLRCAKPPPSTRARTA